MAGRESGSGSSSIFAKAIPGWASASTGVASSRWFQSFQRLNVHWRPDMNRDFDKRAVGAWGSRRGRPPEEQGGNFHCWKQSLKSPGGRL